MPNKEILLDVQALTKTYPGVKAVDEVSFTLHAGEVMALMGENGAGKSTLIKMIAGSVVPDSGAIVIGGKQRQHYDPTTAIAEGIGTIYQELNFVDTISIAENIFISSLMRKGRTPIVDFKSMEARCRTIQEKVGLDRAPSTEVSKLSMGEKQLMEIARAINQNAKVIIFDEPTSALTDNEVEKLYAVIDMLKHEGIGIIYISHKIQEVLRVSDTVLVMRDGRSVNFGEIDKIDQQWIIENMVGREISNMYGIPSPDRKIGETALAVEGLETERIHNITFEVKCGEILGFYGLMGCGSTEIARAVYGADPYEAGTITVFGEKAAIHSPTDALKYGLAYLTNDRKNEGLVLPHSIRQNVCLINMASIMSKIGVSREKELSITEKWIKQLKIKTPTPEKEAGELSGGNQQKVVLAKYMHSDPKIMIFNEPTRGIDIGTKQEFYRLMFELAEQGMAIILVSTEMPEVLAMADRICVVADGIISGELSREEATELKIMNLIYEGELHGKE